MTAGNSARIGPNAILQLIPVLDERLGREGRDALLFSSGIDALPDGSSMIDELPVARLHQQLRLKAPEVAPDIARRAGLATGDYILEHRIPDAAQQLLRVLPGFISARMLARAIAKHAWTFAGSGEFRILSLSPLVFEIEGNPVVRGEASEQPLCAWHAAVFERLYRVLVSESYRVRELHCAAQGYRACRFLVGKSQDLRSL